MYRNVTEIIVEQKLDQLWRSSKCCKCRRCHDDIVAYALNHLPTQYVSTSKGELFNKASSLSIQYDVEVVKAVTIAMKIVEDHPRHPIQESANGYEIFKESN